jgi:hypothetical protein
MGGVGQQLADAGEVLPHGTPEARLGLAVGQVVGGIALTVGGFTGEVLGGAATVTGIGVAVGVPAMVVSTTLVVGGAGNIAAGIRGLMTTGSGNSGGVRVGGKEWKAFEPGTKACQSGCVDVAKSIQKAIGGEIKTFKSPAGPNGVLGYVKNSAGKFVNPAGTSARGWFSHTVVVKDGRVYDALTGSAGKTISEYKALWEYGDVINFGF